MRKLWFGFAAVVVLSCAVLGWTGLRIYQEAPPVPARVVTAEGRQVIGPDDISGGQNVWQSIGGMEVGSVWGHGSYVAPDWTADWLHREAMFILDRWSGASGGYWYAPSPEFLQTGAIEMFRWLRVVGDTIFAAGAVALAIFVMGLRTGGSMARHPVATQALP